jgi:hypothetical protein
VVTFLIYPLCVCVCNLQGVTNGTLYRSPEVSRDALAPTVMRLLACWTRIG